MDDRDADVDAMADWMAARVGPVPLGPAGAGRGLSRSLSCSTVAPAPAVFDELVQATCVTAEPDSDAAMRVSWRGVPHGATLSLGLGTRDRFDGADPRELSWRVLVDGVEVESLTARPRPALTLRRHVLPDALAGAGHELAVEVTAPDDSARHACFFAQVVAPR